MADTPGSPILDFLAQALATLLGALAAFALEALRRRRAERERLIERFKAALFVLILHRQYLRNLHGQKLAPLRGSPVRAYALKPLLTVPPDEKLDVTTLAFLLSTKDAQLLNSLALAESKFRTVVAQVHQRNVIHLALQSKPGVENGPPPGVVIGSLEDFRFIAGPTMSRQLEQCTDELYANCEDAIRFNETCYREAVDCYKRQFPGAPMFGVEDLPIGATSSGS